jgi:predicted DNA-binding protein with PD1-like motif
MIFTETREGRRFAGEIPPGAPLMATLRTLAERYRIDSGWFEGSGAVRDAAVRPLDAEGTLGAAETLPGAAVLASFKATVSLRNGQRDLQAWVVLHGERGARAGQLHEAQSLSVELLAWTLDDITLKRFEDHDAGLWRWLDVAVHTSEADPAVTRSARQAMEAMPSRLLQAEEMPELHVGDALQHPALGLCIVTQVLDRDRIAIQMETGKVAQLHLGVLSLQRGASRQGRTVYDVQVRKRAG